MTDETQKVVAAVAAPAAKRMAREPIYATGFSFTDANMARAKYRNGVSRDKRFDTKIKGLCVEVRPSGTITFYAYKSVHMYNKKHNKWAPNVVYRKMFHWAKNTGFNCEAARDTVSKYVSMITDSKSKADSEITVEYLVKKFIKTGLNGFTLKDDSRLYKEEIINAESAADAKEKVINYCNEQLVDNDRLKEIVEVKISSAKDAVTEIKNKDLPNGRAGNPISS